MIAALFVDEKPGGAYVGLPDVEVWGVTKDARKYTGPHPVVAHPPCERWCRLAGLVEARWGHKRGEDGGCFESALASVRKWGGVLEHPAYTDAWAKYGLPIPPRHGGWQRALEGGWVAHVEQGRYGHRAKKATWLYAYGAALLPSLRWGTSPEAKAWVGWCGNHNRGAGDTMPRLKHSQTAATPPIFRDLLVEIARSSSVGLKSGASARSAL